MQHHKVYMYKERRALSSRARRNWRKIHVNCIAKEAKAAIKRVDSKIQTQQKSNWHNRTSHKACAG